METLLDHPYLHSGTTVLTRPEWMSATLVEIGDVHLHWLTEQPTKPSCSISEPLSPISRACVELAWQHRHTLLAG